MEVEKPPQSCFLDKDSDRIAKQLAKFGSQIFVFEPAKAYSERLTKSIDDLWKLKEVFAPLVLPGPQGDVVG